MNCGKMQSSLTGPSRMQNYENQVHLLDLEDLDISKDLDTSKGVCHFI